MPTSTLHPARGAAFGAPGIQARWTSSAKEGLGTAYHTSCRLWFTLSHGIVNEIYYPFVDQPNTRDIQFLISDGETFCHEEKRDLEHVIEYPERDCPFYRLTNRDPQGRYRIIKHVLADPHRSVLLIDATIEILDPALHGKLRIYALVAPHIARQGAGNTGRCIEVGGNPLLHAMRGDVHLAMGCSSGFSHRSVGFVGASDGWQDLMDNYRLDWEFSSAENGNIALIGEIDIQRQPTFTLAIAMGPSLQSTTSILLQSLAEPFEGHRRTYIRQWQQALADRLSDFSGHTADGGRLYRLSHCVLLAHEDKLFQGAMVASMSIPWGESKGDQDLGGYHLVWTRDLVQSASALLAAGWTGTPIRALIWLATIQARDGSFPQNSWINGNAYWHGYQLDEIAAPILLAWRLRREKVDLGRFDPSCMIFRAAGYLLRNGPVTAQDRWEESAGYSPSTLATIIAAMVCAADFATQQGEAASADLLLSYADWLADRLEQWTATSAGTVVAGITRHYLRITPTDPLHPDPHADPDTAMLAIANGGGRHPARTIVSDDFLHLVRLGIRAPSDPLVVDSLAVIDRVLKQELPQGPCWRRYNHDGYGQKDDGSDYDGEGVGRSWPLLTGERGHYEIAAGRDAMPYIRAMERFANVGGMLPEQLWDGDDLPQQQLECGRPSGSAMPLCWSHAEYISLVRSHHDGVCFDRVEPAYQRYVAAPTGCRFELWSLRYPLRRVGHGRTLRLILPADASVLWTHDGWTSMLRAEASAHPLIALWQVDLPTTIIPVGRTIEFTLFWKADQRWEGRNFSLAVVAGGERRQERSSAAR